jgi:hypothetical protein
MVRRNRAHVVALPVAVSAIAGKNQLSVPMIKLIFRPFSVVTGLLAGMIGKRLLRRVWRLLDDKQPPQAEQRSIPIGKLALALVVEGALFRLVKGLADHGSRRAFAHMTGAWPGEQPESARAEND